MINDFGKILIGFGLLLVLVGLVVIVIGKTGLGKLPGDIVFKRENFTFAFPLATCIVISVVLTVILWILSRFRQ
jgi:hypothetical protein